MFITRFTILLIYQLGIIKKKKINFFISLMNRKKKLEFMAKSI